MEFTRSRDHVDAGRDPLVDPAREQKHQSEGGSSIELGRLGSGGSRERDCLACALLSVNDAHVPRERGGERGDEARADPQAIGLLRDLIELRETAFEQLAAEVRTDTEQVSNRDHGRHDGGGLERRARRTVELPCAFERFGRRLILVHRRRLGGQLLEDPSSRQRLGILRHVAGNPSIEVESVPTRRDGSGGSCAEEGGAKRLGPIAGPLEMDRCVDRGRTLQLGSNLRHPLVQTPSLRLGNAVVERVAQELVPEVV